MTQITQIGQSELSVKSVSSVEKIRASLGIFLQKSHPAGWIDSLLIAYLYWVAFEWTIVSRIPSYAAIQTIRNAMDIIPLALFAISIIVLNPKLKSWDIKILLSFTLILILSSLSLILEHQSPSSITGYIGVTIRFVPLIFLVRLTTENFQAKLFKHVRIVYWMLAGLGFLSLLGKEWFIGLFLPSADIFADALPTTYKDPGISATFINTVEFSFFLLALTIIYLTGSTSKREKLLISLVSLLLCLLSFSIASILGLFLIFFIRSSHKLLMASILAGFIIIGFWFFNDFILQLLGMDIKYWIEISSEFNRLGYITKVFPEFLHGGLKDIFLGMGYDANVVDVKLANYHNTPWVMINNENNLKYLKDVYWLSILIAQGLFVLMATLYILRTIWTGARNEGSWENFQAVRLFILLSLFLGLFNQILDMKAFTYCFWLIAGLALFKPATVPAVNMAIA